MFPLLVAKADFNLPFSIVSEASIPFPKPPCKATFSNMPLSYPPPFLETFNLITFPTSFESSLILIPSFPILMFDFSLSFPPESDDAPISFTERSKPSPITVCFSSFLTIFFLSSTVSNNSSALNLILPNLLFFTVR